MSRWLRCTVPAPWPRLCVDSASDGFMHHTPTWPFQIAAIAANRLIVPHALMAEAAAFPTFAVVLHQGRAAFPWAALPRDYHAACR